MTTEKRKSKENGGGWRRQRKVIEVKREQIDERREREDKGRKEKKRTRERDR